MVIAGMLACAMLVAWLFSVFMEMPFWPLATFFSICALIGIVRGEAACCSRKAKEVVIRNTRGEERTRILSRLSLADFSLSKDCLYHHQPPDCHSGP